MEAYLGEICSLGAAAVWAIAVILFKKSGETVHPIALNLFKNTLAILLFIPTLMIFGGTLIREAPASEYTILLLSGALGIGFADTMFFKSLNRLGAGLSAIVVCMYSPFIIVMSYLYLDEALTLIQFIGVSLILFAVLAATGRNNSSGSDRKAILVGVLWGVISQAANGAGVVMVKPILHDAPLLWVTEVRLIGGAVVLALVLWWHPSRQMIVRSLYAAKSWGYTISGSFAGAYLAMLAWLAGMKYTQASIASALNQMSSIFVFILAAFVLHEKVTLLRVVGIILGVTGAVLVTFG